MKIVKSLGAYCGGLALMLVGFFILDVPMDLATWRWIFGMSFLAAGVLVWDRWA